MADARAHEPRSHEKGGKKHLAEICGDFGRPPRWVLLEEARSSVSWKGAPFLYLFTSTFHSEPPVRRGDSGLPIPTYRLRIPYQQKQDLHFWQGSYADYDRIWLASGVMEMPVYRQLAGPHSELSDAGRELCAEIEKFTRVPTMYYLTRFWARAKGEQDRLCPGCGRAWRTHYPISDSAPFWQFHFRCDECRLVSHLGVTTGGGRHGRIGEWNKGKR